jgi:AcrR family transcriptional regulator
MHARLIAATIECLAERGYARTTTGEIARRAGVSRGAQLHHFSTRADLMTHAVEHLFEHRHAEFVRATTNLPAGADRAAAAVDLLWSTASGPTFEAWIELAVAARTDPELARSVWALARRFLETVEQTLPELFPPPTTPNPLFEAAPTLALALVDGLALQRLYVTDEARAERALSALRNLARLAVPPTGA